MIRVGIMGGSFDPVHSGHLCIAKEAAEQLGLDEVLFIPANRSYNKDPGENTQPEERLDMLRLAVEGDPFFRVCTAEIERGGTTYTVDTLREFKETWGKDRELVFILGADSFLTLEKWREPEELFRLCRFAVVSRPGFDDDGLEERIIKAEEKYDTVIYRFSSPGLDISSTDIRKRISDGRSFRYFMPEGVWKYITDNDLYGFRPEFYPEAAVYIEKLERELKPSRFRHTLGVAGEARKLARVYSEDPHKAYTAGLLHDCAKNFDREKTFELCRRYGVELDEVLKAQPDLIHSFLGAETARAEYGVKDGDILNAIKYHTTGHGGGMSRLEMIIYLSDMIEPNRAYFKGLDKIRKLAYYDLESAMEEALEQTISFNREKGRLIHPLSSGAYSYFKELNRRKPIEQRKDFTGSKSGS